MTVLRRTIALAAGMVVLVGAATHAAASATREGDIRVVGLDDTSAALERGKASTQFVMLLPEDASCPGDTAHDDYRVQTFIVPATDDPADLRFEATKPAGDGRWALYDISTRHYTQASTEPNTRPGEPARIGGLRPVSFSVYPQGTLPDGEYRIGVACTHLLVPEVYWDVKIVIDNGDDESSKLRWRLSRAQATFDGSGPDVTVIVLGGTAAAAAAASVLLRRSARKNEPSPRPVTKRNLS